MKLHRLALIALGTAATTFANEPAIKSVAKQPDEAVLTLNEGTLEVRPMAAGAIRVRFSDGKTTETPSFVTNQKLPPPSFTISETPDAVTVSTEKMKAVVDRAMGTISFHDASGKVFLSEENGTRALIPNTLQGAPNYAVQQGFQSPDDEKLYGLGQFQDGLWNWRGLPIEMRQLNTQIAVPMLISNKGYGLLWDNASRTDFNLPGEEIALKAEDAGGGSNAQGPTATEQLKAGKNSQSLAVRQGSFTTDAAGEYTFCTREGDRSNGIVIEVDGVQIAGFRNIWVPRAIVGKISLPAHKTVSVTVRGGGGGVKLFARLLATDTLFHSDSGEAVDYTVFYGPNLDDVIANYRTVTGNAPLWPQWAYGFWQCRELYSSQQQILNAVGEFRKRQIPVDLLVQDWRYWGSHGWGSYEWDNKNYPDPAEMLKALRDAHFKFMISVWCNPHGKTLEELNKNNLMVGQWIDLFNPQAREIRWKYIQEAFFSIGTDGWWGDATEPGDPGTDLLGKKVYLGPGDRFTSAYPLFASQSLYEGQRATDPNKRVCILTRSAFPGQQRYGAAAWSGDINGTWDSFKRQIPGGLNFCLTGQPYWTTDCGGFFHPKDQYTSADYNELLTRWFQWSTFCPILRIHGFSTETEMWKWLPETQKHLLAFDRLRYRMLPYNYTMGSQITFQGDTFMRALGMDFPDDSKAWDISDEYLFGPAFLVSPVTEPKATQRSVYLPSGTQWTNFWTGATEAGNQTVSADAPIEIMPLFVRAGSIVPLGPDLQYTSEKPADPIELRVYSGANGAFTLYEDEGDSYNYEKGVFSKIPIRWDESKQTLTIGARQGEFPGMLKSRTFRIVWVGKNHGVGIAPEEQADAEIQYHGTEVSVARK